MDFLRGWRLETVDGRWCTVDRDGTVLASRPRSEDASVRAGWLMACLADHSFDAAVMTLTDRDISAIAERLGCRTRSFKNREQAEATVFATLKDDSQGRRRIGRRPDPAPPKLNKNDFDGFIGLRFQGYSWAEIGMASGMDVNSQLSKAVFNHLLRRPTPIGELSRALEFTMPVVAKADEHDKCLLDLQCGRGSRIGILALAFLDGFSPRAAEALARSGVTTLKEAADLDESRAVILVGRRGAHQALVELCDRLDADHRENPSAEDPLRFR
jgi:hypothetical protein